jgi:hypothetical protein
MTLVIPEMLIAKGSMTIAHWLATHGTSASAAKALAILGKSVLKNGLGNTFAGVSGLAIGSSFVVGGYLWTTKHVNKLSEALDALSKGDYVTFVKKCAKLCTLFPVYVEFLPDVVQEYLIEAGLSAVEASNIAEIIANSEDEILKFVSRG